MSFQEIKSEPLGEEVEGTHEHLNDRAEDISNICFDYEDDNKIPIKEEIKEKIKPEPLPKDSINVEIDQEKSDLQAIVEKLLIEKQTLLKDIEKFAELEVENQILKSKNNKLQVKNQNLKSEKKYMKRQLEEKEKEFQELSLDNKCEICSWRPPPGDWHSKSFRQKSIQCVSKHKETMHGIRRHSKTYKCISCSESFDEIGNLKKHLKIEHAKRRDYRCDICSKDFGTMHDFKRHVKNHKK